MSFALGATDTSGILNIDNNVNRPIPQIMPGTERVGSPITMTAKTAAYTWVIGDSGTQIPINTTGGAVTITLPSTVVGMVAWFYASATSSNAINISPAAADKIAGLNVGTIVDNKDYILASPVKGDYIVLFGDGANGWFAIRGSGVWTAEA